MAHEKRIIHCNGPHDPHALHGIPLQPCTGDLDSPCPDCSGHGQWNIEIDLISQRSKRAFCVGCGGRGWIETGDDMIASPDVELSPEGHPMWVVKHRPPR